MKIFKRILAGILSISLIVLSSEIAIAMENVVQDIAIAEGTTQIAKNTTSIAENITQITKDIEISEIANNENIMTTAVDEAYLVSYHIGEYSFQTDTDGNVFAIIDGIKYYYRDNCDINIPNGLFEQENQNVVYTLYNDEIAEIYSVADMLELKIVVEPEIIDEEKKKDGLIYTNAKFKPENFELVVKVSHCIKNDYLNVVENLNETEKERLYCFIKNLSIKPSSEFEDNMVDFGTDGWWFWNDYEDVLIEDINEKIYINQTKEYRYHVKLNSKNATLAMKNYDLDLDIILTYDANETLEKKVKVPVGNLDYQEEKTEEKKETSKSGQTLAEASKELESLQTAIQFSGNYFSKSQTTQINEFVNLWISELILAKYVDKSELEEKVTDKIADKWLEKLGFDTSVLPIFGTIYATTFLETQTKEGERVFIEVHIELIDFDFGNKGMPTMATGSGTITVYNESGEKIDSSVILPAYADVSAFCEQLQEVAKDTIFDGAKKYLGVFGVSAEKTAEALSSSMMTKLLNCKYTKNVFKTVSAKDMKYVLKEVTEKAQEYTNKTIFKLITTPSKEITKVTNKCPVDINVYDSDGNLCGVISDNVVDDTYSDIYMTVVGDQKNIYLVGDDYTFEIIGTDEGTLDYIVEEFDEEGNLTQKVEYEDIPLTDGCKYYTYVPEAGNLMGELFNPIDEDGNDIFPTSGIVERGWCEENAKYVLYEDGTLIIRGEGVIGGGYYWKWNEDIRECIIDVKILEGITGINSSAFYNCSNLTNIEIPNSVTSIGDGAFWGCNSLTNIELPNSVTSIGDGAFSECSSLTSIEMSNSVTSIGDYAFLQCDSLINIEIPNSVTSIGECAFHNCSSLIRIEIPNSVTSIGECAFYNCSSLIRIEIPDSVISIETEKLFYNCSSLTSIKFPNGVTGIGDEAFSECSSLTDIELPNSVTSIGNRAFMGCSSLTNIEIPNSVTNIGDKAFYWCSDLTSIELPNNVTSIGNRAFMGCSSLTNIELPNSITGIEDGTFQDCSSLTSIEVPDSVTSIGDYAFSQCDSLINIELPNTITKIGDRAFATCGSLTSIELPNTITNIGIEAFFQCHSLANIELPNSIISIEDRTFQGCWDLTSVKISDSVTNIGEYAFSNCLNLRSIQILESVINIGSYAFEGCIDLIICGKSDSYAQKYAEENNINFEILSDSDTFIENPFIDVSETQYYYQPVLWAVENNVTSGLTETEFAPEQSCTRGQVVTFLWRAMGEPEPTTTTNPFVDVNSSEYYYKAVLWALENGITSGLDATHFAPDDTVTRGQFVTFLHRTEQKPSYTTSNPFGDVSSGTYYYDAILWAYENGVTSGLTETQFGPEDSCTRGQVVTFLYRALSKK